MKQISLLATFLFCLIISGFSQAYKPLVSESNNWSVVSGGLGIIMKVCSVGTNHYKFQGDTTIQAKDYKKAFSSTDSLKQDWEITAFIREDSVLKKVWLRDLENKEGLIYDFDITLGSEITLYNPFFYDTNTYQITKIDSILIQTDYRKIYTLSIGDWNEQWIEGIGSKFGIINSNIYGLDGGFRELLCFSDNDINYENPKFQTCHKSSFTPLITNQKIDTAYLNQDYNFQITTTGIFDYDSISYFLSGSWLPNGLQINKETGLISGIPTETGTFHLFICVENNGYVTDYLETDLIVDFNSTIFEVNDNSSVKIYPNPSKDLLIIDNNTNNSDYSVTIYDINGKQLIYKLLDKNVNGIDISTMTNGLYLISITDNNLKKTLISDKLIINK